MNIELRAYVGILKCLSFKAFVLLALLLVVTGQVIAEEKIQKHKAKRVEAIQQHIDQFELIQAAFENGDSNRVTELLNELGDVVNKPDEGDDLNQFYRTLSEDNILQAKELANILVVSSEISHLDKAYIYKSLGDYFMGKDDLVSAVTEFKKILELLDQAKFE